MIKRNKLISVRITNLFVNAKKHLPVILLIILCIFLMVSHVFYVFATYQFPEQDEHLYLDIAAAYYRMVQNFSIQTPVEMMNYLTGHPPLRQPLYSLSILIPTLVVGIGNIYKIALILNGLYYIATVIGVYILGKEFFSKKLSLLAAFLFATFGFPLFYLHFAYSETATTTFVIWTLAMLYKVNNFRSRKYVVMFALLFSAALLTRWLSLFFILGPFLFIFLQTIPQIKKNREVIIKNVLIMFYILSPALLYYILGMHAFAYYFRANTSLGASWMTSVIGESNLANPLSVQSAAYYFKIFAQQTVFIFSLFLIGLVLAFTKIKKFTFLLLVFFIPYIVLTFFITLKFDRYIVPIYPVMALLSVVMFYMIPWKKVNRVLITGLIGLSIANFLGAVWGIGPVGVEGLKSYLISMPIGHPRRIHVTPMVWPPRENKTNVHLIYQTLDQNIQENKFKNPTILALFSFHEIDNGLYSYNAYHRVKRLNITNFVGTVVQNENRTETLQYVRSVIKDTDYILVKSTNPIKETFSPTNYTLLHAMVDLRYGREILEYYAVLRIIPVPLDKSTVTIYKKDREIPEDILNKYIGDINSKLVLAAAIP